MSVLVINFNGAALLRQFLPAVCALNYPHLQVYVVDNASTDDSVAYVQQHHPAVTVIRHNRNLGFAEGYNQVIQQLTSDYYLFLNNDVLVAPSLVTTLVNFLEAAPERAVCQPKILDYRRQDHFEYAGAAGGLLDGFGYPFARGRILHACEKDEGRYDADCEIFWATGACLFIKARYFHTVGGFWPHYFMLSEEVDLCWRIQMAGGSIWYTSAATVYHVGGASLQATDPNKTYLNFRNNWMMLYRNLPKQYFRRRVFPARLVLDIAASVYLLFTAGPSHTAAVYRALFYFLRWHHPSKRLHAQYPFLKMKGVLPASVILGYLLSGKKKYSDYHT